MKAFARQRRYVVSARLTCIGWADILVGARMNDSVLSKLSGHLAGHGQALCAWVTMNEPAVAEALAREAFDAVVLDMQHGACGQTDHRSHPDRRICLG